MAIERKEHIDVCTIRQPYSSNNYSTYVDIFYYRLSLVYFGAYEYTNSLCPREHLTYATQLTD